MEERDGERDTRIEIELGREGRTVREGEIGRIQNIVIF